MASVQEAAEYYDGEQFIVGPFPRYGCYTKIPAACWNCEWRNQFTGERLFVGVLDTTNEHAIWENKPNEAECIRHHCGGISKA